MIAEAVSPDVSHETEQLFSEYEHEVHALRRRKDVSVDEIGSRLINLYLNVFKNTDPERYLAALQQLDLQANSIRNLFPQTFSDQDIRWYRMGARAEIATMRLLEQSDLQIAIPSTWEDRIDKTDLYCINSSGQRFPVQTKNVSQKVSRSEVSQYSYELPVFSPVGRAEDLIHFLSNLAMSFGNSCSPGDLHLDWAEQRTRNRGSFTADQLEPEIINRLMNNPGVQYEFALVHNPTILSRPARIEQIALGAVKTHQKYRMTPKITPMYCILNGNENSDASDFDYHTCRPNNATARTAARNIQDINTFFNGELT